MFYLEQFNVRSVTCLCYQVLSFSNISEFNKKKNKTFSWFLYKRLIKNIWFKKVYNDIYIIPSFYLNSCVSFCGLLHINAFFFLMPTRINGKKICFNFMWIFAIPSVDQNQFGLCLYLLCPLCARLCEIHVTKSYCELQWQL